MTRRRPRRRRALVPRLRAGRENGRVAQNRRRRRRDDARATTSFRGGSREDPGIPDPGTGRGRYRDRRFDLRGGERRSCTSGARSRRALRRRVHRSRAVERDLRRAPPIANPAAFERAVATGGDSAPSAGTGRLPTGPAVKPAGTAPAGSSFALGPGNEVRSLGGTGASSTDRRWSARTSSVPLGAFDRTGAVLAAAGAASTTADDDDEIFVGAHAGAVRAPPRRRVLARPRRARRRPRPRRRATCEAERRRRPRALVVRARGAGRPRSPRAGTRTWRPYGLAGARGLGPGSRPSSGTPTPRVSRRRRRPLRAPPPDRSPSRSSRPRRRYRPRRGGARDRAGSGFSGVSKKLFRVTSPGGEKPRPGVGREGRGRGGVAAARRSRRGRGGRGRKPAAGSEVPEEEEEEGPGPAPDGKGAARAREAGRGRSIGRSEAADGDAPVPSRARRVRVRRGWGGCRCTSPRRSGTVRAGRSCSPGARRSPRRGRACSRSSTSSRAPSSPRSSPRRTPERPRCFAMEEDADFVYVALERAKKRSRGASRRRRREGAGVTKKTMTETKTETKTARANGRYRSSFLRRDADRGFRDGQAHGVRGAAHARRVRGDARASRAGHRAQGPEAPERPRHLGGRGKVADMGLAKRLDLAEGTSFGGDSTGFIDASAADDRRRVARDSRASRRPAGPRVGSPPSVFFASARAARGRVRARASSTTA